MTFSDYIVTGITNIRRNRLRSVLTIIGVSVAIGALVSMLSFGIGIQTNIVKQMKDNRTMKRIMLFPSDSIVEFNDSVMARISTIENVVAVFPEIDLPAKVSVLGQSQTIIVRALSEQISDLFENEEFAAGNFFTSDTSKEIILFRSDVSNFLIKNDTSLKGKQLDKEISELIGHEIDLVTLTYDTKAMSSVFSLMTMATQRKVPIRDSTTVLKIAGILSSKSQFGDFNVKAYIPIGLSKNIPSLGFENVKELLKDNIPSGFEMLNVYVDEINNLSKVQDELNSKGHHTKSILDNFEEMKKLFLIMDSILGAIGIMALFIATLGLVNTLVMSIYERTREIGIMKSLGAKDSEIRALFIVEASSIGIIGGLTGLPLGWGITKLVDLIFTRAVFTELEDGFRLFSFPFYLILGAMAFAILFSVLAGLYPANRASKVDPVKALRHD